MEVDSTDYNTPIMESISHRLSLLSNLCELPVIWKVGIKNEVTLKLPRQHSIHCHKLCWAVKDCSATLEGRCIHNDIAVVGNIIQENKYPFCNRCHVGCEELIVPIYYGDCYIATIFVGPFRRVGHEAECTIPELQPIFDTLPYQSEEKIKALMEFIPEFFIDLLPDLNPNISTHLLRPIQDYAEYPTIVKAMDYAKRHLREQIAVTDVAGKCYMSVSNFQHRFRRVTGLSFSEYLQRLRILEAEKLLLYTQLPISKIAILCRLTDQSRMTKLFRQYYNFTPAILRKKFHQNSQKSYE